MITRENAIICGIDWATEAFHQVDDSVNLEWLVGDGEEVTAGDTLLTLHGPARSILTAERTALNFLQTLSGTATTCYTYTKCLQGGETKILDTRKTIPGLRLAQKYAVSCGGCHNHRIGLYDAYLIKENHIAACGSIEAAITKAKAQHTDKPVEIEVENIDELQQALEAGANIVMLDNFDIETMKQAVKINGGRARLEASGNMSLERLPSVANTGVDYISIGALTKHVRAVDLSMQFIKT